jgi:hypothetical protein
MTHHQRLAALVLSALLASACGGGNGTPTAPYDPNAPPKLADQPAKLADQPAHVTDATPPDDSQLPVSPPPDYFPVVTCQSLCQRLAAADCRDDTENCFEDCNKPQNAVCLNEASAVIDCTFAQGYCPGQIDEIDEPVLDACRHQIETLIGCAADDDS